MFSYSPLDFAFGLLSFPGFQSFPTTIVRDLGVLFPSLLSRQFVG